MKRNDSGDFSVLYVEPNDDKAALFQVIAGQKKPVVIMLAEQTHVFQRPDDFTTLKHVKRQLDLPIVFILPNGGQLAQQAARNGFPVYLSMDALADALVAGQLARQRTPARSTTSTAGGETRHPSGNLKRPTHSVVNRGATSTAKKTVPLSLPPEEEQLQRNTTPLIPLLSPVTTPLTPSAPAGSPIPVPMKPLEAFPSLSVPTYVPPSTHTVKPIEPVLPLPERPVALPVHSQVARPTAPAPRQRQPSYLRFPWFLIILACVLIFGGLGAFLMFTRPATTPAPLPNALGSVSFTSSEQLSENSSQGIEDQVVIDLTNVVAPAPHKSYYVWLLADKNQTDPRTVPLGVLPVNHGHAHLFYPGDKQHSNLLLLSSRFVVTEEDATVPPISPSPDLNTWRYYGEFSTSPINSPDNVKHFSYLDHLRHLLGSDPTLDQLELPGGLNNWFFRNTGKVLEWASSTREQWEQIRDAPFIRDQLLRIFEYLDGTSFVSLDIPSNTPLLVNERLARIGLLEVNGANQEPPSYLAHIVHHLNGLLQSNNATPTLRKNIADLVTALNNVQFWLNKLRQDAQQISKLTDAQIKQDSTLTLLNDLIDNANHAYTGQLEPDTNTMREGTVWIHDHMQSLALLNVTKFTAANGASHPTRPDGNQPAMLSSR